PRSVWFPNMYLNLPKFLVPLKDGMVFKNLRSYRFRSSHYKSHSYTETIRYKDGYLQLSSPFRKITIKIANDLTQFESLTIEGWSTTFGIRTIYDNGLIRIGGNKNQTMKHERVKYACAARSF
ncbi:MAG: hypothetical protein K2X47_07505, partial [Bdellovibrionales bacterium]|nr:hypothetical protein [Bdellovibrionales bacterium]